MTTSNLHLTLNAFIALLCVVFFLCQIAVKAKQISSVNKYLKTIPGCDQKALRKADRTLSRLVTTGASGRKFPESQSQLPSYCRYVYVLDRHCLLLN